MIEKQNSIDCWSINMVLFLLAAWVEVGWVHCCENKEDVKKVTLKFRYIRHVLLVDLTPRHKPTSVWGFILFDRHTNTNPWGLLFNISGSFVESRINKFLFWNGHETAVFVYLLSWNKMGKVHVEVAFSNCRNLWLQIVYFANCKMFFTN